MKLKKLNVLHLGRNKSMLGLDWLESSFVEKDLGVLTDTKLNMSQQCALAAQSMMAFWAELEKTLPGQGR